LFGRRREDRFEREVLCHVRTAYNLARWLLNNDQDAEDAVQEANLKALRGIDGYRGDEPKSWYLAIVRNTCLNMLRSKNRRAEIELDDSAPAVAPSPSDLVERSYDAGQLRRAIEQLPFGWRELIVLREFEQMSYREMAEVSGIPVGTVMSRLSRARERLHRILSEVSQ
jgi:RNA polymerase sigma-70 factor (ECF subfamily)